VDLLRALRRRSSGGIRLAVHLDRHLCGCLYRMAGARPPVRTGSRWRSSMNAQRLNSFTDGVIAIIITIMVLALPVPTSGGMQALQPLSILFAAYALSFFKVGIYWFQHHHMLLAS